MRSLQMLFDSNALKSGDSITSKLNSAAGGLERKLPSAINNAADQVSRLRNALDHAADPLIEKLNDAIAGATTYLMDKKGMSGTEIAGLGAAAGLGAWLVGRRVKGGVGRMLNGVAGTAAGVAEGKALQMAAGVTPVFVTNWPGSGGIGGGGGGPSGGWQEYIGLGGGVGDGAGASKLPWWKTGATKIGGLVGSAGGAQAIAAALAVPVTAAIGMIVAGKIGQDQFFKARYGVSMDEFAKAGHLVEPAAPSFNAQSNVNVFIDGQKVKPSKVVSSNRGSFDATTLSTLNPANLAMVK
jgi:hypothetical protein